MRRATLLALGFVVFLGCRSEVSEPELRRPLEAMPEGACVLMLASDLANTWERAEAHDAMGVLQRSLPADVIAPPELVQLQARLAEFEQQSGVDARQDLVLNLLRRRLAVGVYPDVAGDDPGMLFVAELEDAERFRKSLDAFLLASEPQWETTETEVNGKRALRVHDGKRLDLFLVQEEELLVVATQKSLVRGALEVQQGRREASALRDSLCIEALEALGPHSVAVVELHRESGVAWGAQGFTWNRDGVHFKRVVPSPIEPSEEGDPLWNRDAILASIPTGMTLAYYARPAEASRLRDLFRHGSCMTLRSSARPLGETSMRLATGEASGGGMRIQAAVDAPLGLDRLPFELVKDISRWAGDEMALVIEAFIPTNLAPVPSLALLVETTDPDMAARSLGSLEGGIPMLPFLAGQEFTDVSYGGKTFRSLSQPFMEVLAPSYLVEEDLVIIATTRELMQRIIDTRRAGKRSLTRHAPFRSFASFVPDAANAVVYADQTKLHRMLVQVADLPQLWGDDMVRGVEILEGMAVLFEHFPASVAYIEQAPHTLVLSGWMQEQD